MRHKMFKWALVCCFVMLPAGHLSGATHTVSSHADSGPGTLDAVMNGGELADGDTIAVKSGIGKISFVPATGVRFTYVNNNLHLKGDSRNFDLASFYQANFLPLYKGLSSGQLPEMSTLASRALMLYGQSLNLAQVELNGQGFLSSNSPNPASGLSFSNFIITGGGESNSTDIVSVYSTGAADAVLGDMRNLVFGELSFRGRGSYSGGVISAASNSTGNSQIGQISGVGFYDIDAIGSGYINGGAIGVASAKRSTLAGISNSVFINIKNSTNGGFIRGGAVSVESQDASALGLIENSLFVNIKNTASTSITGGAIYLSNTSASPSNSMEGIKNSLFMGVTSISAGTVSGGAIFADALAEPLMITDSLFLGNSIATSSSSASGGAIYLQNSKGLELSATAGGLTMFSGNSDWTNASAPRPDGIFLTDVPDFKITTAKGGKVAMLDPMTVANNSTAFNAEISGAGETYWGGNNQIYASGGSSINFAAGSTTYLQPDFTLTNSYSTNSSNMDVNFGDTATGESAKIILDLSNRAQLGESGSVPIFDGAAGNTTKLEGKADLDIIHTGFEPVSGEWQIIGGNVDDSGFDRQSSGGSSFFEVTDGTAAGSIQVSNQGLISYFENNSNKSVQSAFNSGALNEAWKNSYGSGGENNFTAAQVFNDILSHPSHYVAESSVTSALLTRSIVRAVGSKALALENKSLQMSGLRRAGAPASVMTASNGYEYFQSITGYEAYPAVYTDVNDALIIPAAAELDRNSEFYYYPRPRVWGGYMFGTAEQKSRKGAAGYDSDYTGIVAGVSIDFSRSFSMGAYISRLESDSDALNTKLDTEAYSAGLIMGIHPGKFNITLDLNGAYFDNNMTRTTVISENEADFNQYAFGGGLNAAYAIDGPLELTISPFAGYRYQFLKQERYKEYYNVALSNSIKGFEATTHTASFGLALTRDFAFSKKVSFSPLVSAAYRHEFGDTDITTDGKFTNNAQVFKINSLEAPTNFFDFGLGLKLDVYNLSLEGSYKYSTADKYSSHEGYVGLGIRF